MLIVSEKPEASIPKRFAVGPIAIRHDHGRIKVILDTVELLIARQRRDGSWGHHGALDKLICTCHTTMTLLSAGVSLDEAVLKRARDWLISPEPAQHNNSYWIAGPLIAWKSDEAIVKVIRKELSKLAEGLDGGAQPHPDQFAQAFYIAVVAAVPAAGDLAIANRYLEYIKSMWSPTKGWAQRPDTTTQCYSVLAAHDPEFAQQIRSDVIKLIGGWADRPEPSYVEWRSPISTAYTIMNMVESRLSADPFIGKLNDDATAWLFASRDRDGFWISQLPYGGTGDIKSSDYPTAAVCRALIAHTSLEIQEVQAAILSARYRKARGIVVMYRATAAAAVLLYLGLFVALNAAAISQAVIAVTGQRAEVLLGVIGVIVALAAWVFPNAREAVSVYLRKKLL